MKKFLARHSPLAILACLCVLLAILAPAFRSADNLTNVAYRTVVVGIMAVGQTLVILTAGIDLSVGSVAALSGIVTCLLAKTHIAESVSVPVMACVLAGCSTGLLCGLINGTLVAKGRIPPFIVTLGMMMVARGLAQLLSGSISLPAPGGWFPYLGGAKGWWIPVAIMLVTTIFFAVVLATTRFGRAVYAVGGNLSTARLSGIPVDRVRIGAYALCGLMAGFAGVILTSRTTIGSPTAGQGMELDAIAGCVIGGSSLMGGEGGCVGTLAGALIQSVLINFCNLKRLDSYWQQVLVGVLIVALVYYDSVRKRRAGVLKD